MAISFATDDYRRLEALVEANKCLATLSTLTSHYGTLSEPDELKQRMWKLTDMITHLCQEHAKITEAPPNA